MSTPLVIVVSETPAPVLVTVASGPAGPAGPAGEPGPAGVSGPPVLLLADEDGPPNEIIGQGQQEQINVTTSGPVSGSYAVYITRNNVTQQLTMGSLGNSAVTAAAAIRARLTEWAATPEGSGAVISGGDTTIYLTLAPAANDPSLNISLPGINGIVNTPSSTNLSPGIAPQPGVAAVAIGQLCRRGSEPPYLWYIANDAGTGPDVWALIQTS